MFLSFSQNETFMRLRHLLFFLLFCLPVANGLAQKAPRLVIQIHGMRDSACVIGHYLGNNQFVPKDTARFDGNGRAIFLNPQRWPGGVYIASFMNRHVDFLLDGKEVSFSLVTDTASPVLSMKVTGSKENQILYDYQRFFVKKGIQADSLKQEVDYASGDSAKTALLQQELTLINREVSAFRAVMKERYKGSFAVKVFEFAQEPDFPPTPLLPSGVPDTLFRYHYYRTHYFDNMDFSDGRLVRTPVFYTKIANWYNSVLPQVPDTIIASTEDLLSRSTSEEITKHIINYVTSTYETSPIMGMDAVFIHMVDTYFLTGKAPWINQMVLQRIQERADILRPLLLGKDFPDLALPDPTNTVRRLRDVAAPFTVVFFWDPECALCQKEIPRLRDVAFADKDLGLQVYAVSIERSEEKWRSAIQEKGMVDWINVFDPKYTVEFRRQFDIYSTPVIYVLDKDKKIIAKRLGATKLSEFLKNWTSTQAGK